MSSLDLWKGGFGEDYTDRQPELDPTPVFKRILHKHRHDIRSYLEVGCNRGDNLLALRKLWELQARFGWGLEPNIAAWEQARKRGLLVSLGEAQAIPWGDGEFDLVFTAGVLIHIDPAHIDRAMHEIHRVSRRYILTIEYEHWNEQGFDYRGVHNGIWKRDYGGEWLNRYPGLSLVKWWPERKLRDSAFDGCSAWLLDKRPSVKSGD